jgi:hypothetical protein
MASNKQFFHLPPKGKSIPKYVDIKKEITDRNVVALEIVKGHSMIISYDALNKLFEIEYESNTDKDESNSAFLVLDGNINNKKYAFYNNVRIVADMIGGGEVDFALYGEFIDEETQRQPYVEKDKADFLLYDIYVNDNWMCQDDIDRIAEKSKMRLAPKIFEGKFNEVKLNKIVEGKSSYNSKLKRHSIIVKPTLEDEYNNKRIATKFTSSIFKKKEPVKDDSEFNKKCSSLAQEVINKHLTNNVVSTIEKTVRKKYPAINGVNKDKALSYSVNEAINVYLSHNIYFYAYKYFGKAYEFRTVHETVRGYMKKKVPHFFLKQYKLN